MREVVYQTSNTIISSKTVVPEEAWCASPQSEEYIDTHLRRASGRSDLVKSDGIKPSPYHRYDLSFTAGNVEEGQTMSQAGPRSCYSSSRTPRLVTYWVTEKSLPNSRMAVTRLIAQDAACVSTGNSSTSWRPLPGAGNISRARAQALSRARRGVANHGENLLELKRSLNQMDDIVNSLAGALNAARRRNWKLMQKHLGLSFEGLNRNLPNKYLEYQYGWKPLVTDLVNTVNSLGNAFDRNHLVSTVKGESQDTVTSYGGYTTTRGCEVGYVYRVNDSKASALASFGLDNPLLAGWEAMSYSFLIDWLLPVSDYLKAIGGIGGSTVVHGYQTSWVRGSGTLELSRYGATAKCSGRSFAMRRIVLYDYAKPQIFINLGFSPKKALDSLALLAQRRA